jgi:hypothetical protein
MTPATDDTQTGVSLWQSQEPLAQRLVRPIRQVPIAAHRNRHQPAHPALTGSILLTQPACIRPSVYELRLFFAITALSISRLRLKSATNRFKR